MAYRFHPPGSVEGQWAMHSAIKAFFVAGLRRMFYSPQRLGREPHIGFFDPAHSPGPIYALIADMKVSPTNPASADASS